MKKLYKAAWVLLVLAALAVAFAVSSGAAPALSVEQAYSQPGDGEFYGTPFGDEYFHYVKAKDGALLTRGEDGVWYYAGTDARYLLDTPAAQVDGARWIAEQAAAHPPLGYSASLPVLSSGGELASQAVTGEQPILILLVDFQDIKIQYESGWAEKIFGSGNSVKRFYSDATGGKINIVPAQESYAGAGAVGDGVVRVSLNYKHPNNGGNKTIAIDAIKAAAGAVNYALYDKNKDGKITSNELHILVVCAGYEDSSSGGGDPCVWAHHYTALTNFGSAGGKSFVSYMMVGEMHGTHMATIGPVCHELGHGFGLPDLYCNGESAGLGGFSLMASGSWGYTNGQHAGETPVFPDAYCLELLGAFPVQTLPTGTSFNGAVKSISTGDKNILRLNVPGSKEYFLIENRQMEMYDAGMWRYSTFNGGVAVYRINTQYQDNYVDGRQVATLLEADEAIWGYSSLQNGFLYGNDPFFYVDDYDHPVRLNRLTEPSTALQGGGSGWFDFTCLSGPDTSMDIEIKPILSASPASMAIGYRSGTGKITVTGATGPVSFTPRDTDIVTVDGGGNVSAVPRGVGTTVIDITDGSAFSEMVTVTV